MEPVDLPERELSSWKEIAAYLGVSVRTAQSWERERGLPIRRVPGGRTVVSLSVAELETWKRSGSNATAQAPSQLKQSEPPSRRWLYAAALVPLALTMYFYLRPGHPIPFDVRFEGAHLVVVDSRGGDLWRKEFPESLVPEVSSLSRRRVWIGDLDGDGRPEVLFAYRGFRNLSKDQVLVCYSSDGQERWRYQPGHTIRRSEEEAFPPPYWLQSLAVTLIQGHALIALSAHHHLYSPAQISLLDETGHLLGSYWHGGHLSESIFADLEQAGRPLLYLGGINNVQAAATLVVLDPRTLRGEHQATGGPFLDIPEIAEYRKVLFPRSAMNEQFEQYNGVNEIQAIGNQLTIHVGERYEGPAATASVKYHLDASLRLTQMNSDDRFSHNYTLLHKAGMARPRVADELDRLRAAYPLSFH